MKRVHILLLLLVTMYPVRSQVKFAFSTDKSIYRVGDTVHAVVVATNDGPSADTLYFATGLQANYLIDSFDFSLQFAWTQAPTLRPIPPHESITWDFANPAREIPSVQVGNHAVIGMVVGHWTSDTLWIKVNAITGTSESVDGVREYFLANNYPNPFNPATTLRYGLPQLSRVSLAVFNTLGQQVITLVDAVEDAGYHDVRFDGSGLASGVYFYRLTAGEYVATKRLVLVR